MRDPIRYAAGLTTASNDNPEPHVKPLPWPTVIPLWVLGVIVTWLAVYAAGWAVWQAARLVVGLFA